MTAKQKKSSKTNSQPQALREPTSAEREAIAAAKARRLAREPRVSMKIERTGDKIEIGPPHSDLVGWADTLTDALGTGTHDFAEMELAQVMETLDPTGKRPKAYAALAIFGAITPRDELEAIVAGQIAATNYLSLDCLGRASRADTMDKRDAFIAQATKLSRTLAVQIEALEAAKWWKATSGGASCLH